MSSTWKYELTVYIPTFGRFGQCLEQVSSLNSQRSLTDRRIRVVVAVNGDSSYVEETLRSSGADVVVNRPINLGGNANICLGFEWMADSQYLWILSDDDGLKKGGMKRVLDAIDSGPDLIVGTHGAPAIAELSELQQGDLVRSGAFLDLVSASIYRTRTFIPIADVSFERIITSYPHACLILEAECRDLISRATLININELVDTSASVIAANLPRSNISGLLGPAFFGGGLAATMGAEGRFARTSFNRWWRKHWHRAAMYRRTPSVQQAWVDNMAKSSPISAFWWALSLPPYWRLKDRLRPIEDRTSHT